MAYCVGVGKTCLHQMTINISCYKVFAIFTHLKQKQNWIKGTNSFSVTLILVCIKCIVASVANYDKYHIGCIKVQYYKDMRSNTCLMIFCLTNLIFPRHNVQK